MKTTGTISLNVVLFNQLKDRLEIKKGYLTLQQNMTTLKENDIITGFNGVQYLYYGEVKSYVKNESNNRLTLQVKRKDQEPMVKTMLATDFLECRHKPEREAYYIYYFNEKIEVLQINDRILTTGKKLQTILNKPITETFIQLYVQRDASENFERKLMSIASSILDSVQYSFCARNRAIRLELYSKDTAFVYADVDIKIKPPVSLIFQCIHFSCQKIQHLFKATNVIDSQRQFVLFHLLDCSLIVLTKLLPWLCEYKDHAIGQALKKIQYRLESLITTDTMGFDDGQTLFEIVKMCLPRIVEKIEFLTHDRSHNITELKDDENDVWRRGIPGKLQNIHASRSNSIQPLAQKFFNHLRSTNALTTSTPGRTTMTSNPQTFGANTVVQPPLEFQNAGRQTQQFGNFRNLDAFNHSGRNSFINPQNQKTPYGNNTNTPMMNRSTTNGGTQLNNFHSRAQFTQPQQNQFNNYQQTPQRLQRVPPGFPYPPQVELYKRVMCSFANLVWPIFACSK